MIYLDNAATSHFKPKEVYENINWALTHSANPTRSGHNEAIKMAEKVYSVREMVASLYNAPDESRVIFTKNCTESLNLAIFGSFQEKSHVITTENEHNSTLRPLFHLKKKGLIDLTILPVYIDGSIRMSDLKKAMRKKTTMVCINHVSNVTGGENPIYEIGEFLESYDVTYIIDGAQSSGYIPVDFQKTKADFLALPAHKGLCSPMGLGFLIASEDARLRPLIFGGTGTFSNDIMQPKGFPDGFEAGTIPAVAICGAIGGVGYVQKNQNKIINQMKKFFDVLYSYKFPKNIRIFSVKNCCGIFSFLINDMPSSEISEILNERYDIATRSGITCAPLIHRRLGTSITGVTRASFSSFNTMNECDTFINAICEIAKNR